MKVFNNSATRFAHHELVLAPGITDIQAERQESVSKLVEKYPTKLSLVAPGATSPKATADALHAKDAEIAKLQGQVSKLQELLTKDPSQMEPKAVANKRADKAEGDLKEARGEIASLRAELAALKETNPS